MALLFFSRLFPPRECERDRAKCNRSSGHTPKRKRDPSAGSEGRSKGLALAIFDSALVDRNPTLRFASTRKRTLHTEKKVRSFGSINLTMKKANTFCAKKTKFLVHLNQIRFLQPKMQLSCKFQPNFFLRTVNGKRYYGECDYRLSDIYDGIFASSRNVISNTRITGASKFCVMKVQAEKKNISPCYRYKIYFVNI